MRSIGAAVAAEVDNCAPAAADDSVARALRAAEALLRARAGFAPLLAQVFAAAATLPAARLRSLCLDVLARAAAAARPRERSVDIIAACAARLRRLAGGERSLRR